MAGSSSSGPRGGRGAAPGWCSLRLRFDERERALLRAAERLRGAQLAHHARPELLRGALALAKAGQKVARGAPGAAVALAAGDVQLLLEATRAASDELHWASEQDGGLGSGERRAQELLRAFPELAEPGAWRAFSIRRELQALAGRLGRALGTG